MAKRFFIAVMLAVIGLFLVFVIFVAAPFLLKYDSAGNSDETREAWTWFASEMEAAPSCLTPDGVREIAAKRDWLVETHDDFPWCIDRSGLTGWISVTTEPALAFSTDDENRTYFGFDANGCSADWSYSIDCD